MSEITAREKYCTVLMNQPMLHSDALVVLAGEDWEPRIKVARAFKLEEHAAAVARGAPTGEGRPVVVSGGLEDSPRLGGAETMNVFLMGAGVAPDQIIVENESKNTREQAVHVVEMAMEKEWTALLLIASPYHCYRVHLSFVRRLIELEQDETIRVQVAPTAHVPEADVPWFGAPSGMDDTRLELLGTEFAKIGEYPEHVATWDEGLEYLEFWECQ